MEHSFVEKVDTLKSSVGKTILTDEDIVMLAADEISRTTTFNELHSRNAANASKQ